MRRRADGHALRTGAAALLAAALTLTAATPDVEIPRKFLDHEARVRAALTPAEKAREAALKPRLSSRLSVHDVTALTRGESLNTMFVMMMEYMKMVQKEAREDRKITADSGKQALAAKSSKLAQANAQIDAKMREAKEKAQNLMDAATTGMAIGVSQGLVQVGAAGFPSQGATGSAPGQGLAGSKVSTAGSAAAPGLAVPTRTPTKAPSPGK